jgi:hypothetical protein
MPLGFTCLTNNLAVDCAIGESQLSVQVTEPAVGSVQFTFQNVGPEAAVISEIYFDYGSLLSLSNVVDGPGVDFEPGASPPNLPGGQNAISPFEVTEGFQAVPAPPKNGVGPSEWVVIEFDLLGGQTINDVIAELTTGELRIGVHVIAFATGGSESFINPPIPEPGTALLLGGGLVILFLVPRHRRRR